MIYLDTSVVLARLLVEGRLPPQALWQQALISSRLLEYEVWTRLHAQGVGETHGGAARELLEGIALLELAPLTLARALEPFPIPVRTLDALHLATIEFLRSLGRPVLLATYDRRMTDAARLMSIPLYPL